MKFDVDGARRAGYSSAEIAEYLKSQSLFDVDGARASGYTDDEIVAHFGGRKEEPKAQDRGVFGAVNDTVIEIANAAVGNLGAITEFVAPDNRIARATKEFVRRGEESQSDVVKQEKRRFRQGVEQADGFGEEAAEVLKYVARNPLLAAGQAAGSFAGPGLAIKGAQAGATALGAGAQMASRIGLGAGAVVGGGMAGGDAAGTAFDMVMEIPEEVLRSTDIWTEMEAQGATPAQIRERIATDAAKDARIIPALVGAAGGLIGAERLVAGLGRGAGGRLAQIGGAAAVEGVQEGIEEGVTGYSGRAAAAEVDPSIDPMKGLGADVTMGATLGTMTGGAAGAISPRRREEEAVDAGLDRIDTAGSVDDVIAAAQELSGTIREIDQTMGEYLRGEDRQGDLVVDQPGQPGQPARRDLQATQRGLDREAELLAQAQGAGTQFERDQAAAQAAAAREVAVGAPQEGAASRFVDLTPARTPAAARAQLEMARNEAQRLGQDPSELVITSHPSVPRAFAIARQEIPTVPRGTSGPSAQEAQQRIESQAMAGQEANRRAEDSGRQALITRTMRSIEERGGVASPYEAQVLREAGLGRPYDRIDESLAPPLREEEALTQATGIAVGRPPKETIRPGAEQQAQAERAQEAAAADAARTRANEASARQQQARQQLQQQARAVGERAQAEAAARPPAPVSIADVEAALRLPPFQRSQEQRAMLRQARQEIPAADMELLGRSLTNPASLSAEERVAVRRIREQAGQRSEAAAGQAPATRFSTRRERDEDTLRRAAQTHQADGTPEIVQERDLASAPAAREGELQELSRETYQLAQRIARLFGKRVVAFRGGVDADGFVDRSDPNTIYLNVDSQKSHMVVFGHELLHLLRRDMPQAYEALRKVVEANVDAEGRARFEKNYGSGADIEELTADLVGNRFMERGFWDQVFQQLATDVGPARAPSAVMRMGQLVSRAISLARKALRSERSFMADQVVADLNQVRDAVVSAVGQYAANRRQAMGGRDAEQDAGQDTGAAESRRSDRREDAAGDRSQAAGRPQYGAPREGAISAVGVHYSRQPRTRLSSAFYGTGYAGAEIERLGPDVDRRLRQRVYFYVDRGQGVRPEAGVGGYAHDVELNNLYDSEADPLFLLADARGVNEFEAAVIDAGFDGYYQPNFRTDVGAVVLLGRHDVPVRQVGQGALAPRGDVAQRAERPTLSGWRAVAEGLMTDRALPSGEVAWSAWPDRVQRAAPELYAQAEPSGIWEWARAQQGRAYRDELVRRYREMAQGDQRVAASTRRDGERRGQGRGLAPLPGAPAVEGASGPDPQLVAVAEQYARENGIELRRQREYVDVDPERARRIADAYEAMEHAPNDPRVREAYENLIRQTEAQYRALEAAGYRFYFFGDGNDPYQGNPWNAMRDLRANKVMGVYATEAGFGSSDLDVSGNPLLADTGITWPDGSLDGQPKRVLANDLFRAVHDAFGHGLEGAGFRARGEENAWQAHVRLFTGSAVGAITTETRGQNSWLNYGPYGEQNQTARVEDTVFADQKTGLMPEWTWTEGRADDIAASTRRAPTQVNASGESAASLEAQSRLRREREAGQARLRYERGVITPLIGVDAVDTRVRPGQVILQRNIGRDEWSVLDRADDVRQDQVARAIEAARIWARENRDQGGPIPTGEARELGPDELGDIQFSRRRDPQTETEAFKRWFGDSKVVDAEGKPLVVYHGTFDTFDAFDKLMSGDGGFHFGTREAAQARLDYWNTEPTGQNILPVYLAIKNPKTLTVDPVDEESWSEAIDAAKAEGYDGIRYSNTVEVAGADALRKRAESALDAFRRINKSSSPYFDSSQEARAFREANAEFKAYLKAGATESWVAFRPEQIKSATGNRGTFDPEDPDIRRSARRAESPLPDIGEHNRAILTQVAKNLLPAERAKLNRGSAERLVERVLELPTPTEMAAVAWAGRAKRGWYRESAQAIANVFGPDAPLFARLLAALSPQTSVELNLLNTLNTWKNWVADGRPTDPIAIRRVLGRSVVGSRGEGSVLPAWVPNAVRALNGKNLLSGPKVNSFALNLLGDVDEVTNDAWMANYALVDQKIFGGGMNALETDPGKGTGYLAMSAQVRAAAKKLTRMTGEKWSPAEVQETIWSWAKTLYEQQVGGRTARQVLADGGLTDDLIRSTPDFRTLFHDDTNERILRDAGYARELDALRESLPQRQAEPAGEEAGALAPDAVRRQENRAAQRLEELKRRGEQADGDIALSRRRDPQTETEAFKRWFGDSKVVDENGDPLVVYHATPEDFSEFMPGGIDPTISGRAIWFTDNQELQPAMHRIASMSEDFRPGTNVMPVYLKMRRPLVIDNQDMLGWARDVFAGGSREFPQLMPQQWVDEVTRDGEYDGIIFDGPALGWRDAVREYIVFEPTQVKSAIGNRGTFDPTDPDIRRSARRRNDESPTWYSQLRRAILQAPERLSTMPADQWAQWLKSNAAKMGVKQEEINWSGIEDYLQLRGKDKLSRDELAGWVDQNGVKVEEVVLGGDENREPEMVGLDANGEAIYDDGIRTGARYEEYTLPGGTNYREVLLTLPQPGRMALRERAIKARAALVDVLKDPAASDAEKARIRSEYDAIAAQLDASPPYKSSHWDQPNVLAHLRLNDRIDADGKRVLFIEEIQSDWAQEGKKKGFDTTLNTDGWTAKPGDGDPASGPIWEVRNESGRWVLGVPVEVASTAQAAIAYAARAGDANRGGGQGGLPRAPFVGKTDAWVALALKRVMKMAADEGYDRVALINGEQSAQRYDLSKQVSEMYHWRDEDGDYGISAYDMNGSAIIDQRTFKESELEGVVGKEVAERIIKREGEDAPSQGEGVRLLSGEGLKIGGEGMRAFYDKIVPAVAKDVLKKLGGGSLRELRLPTETSGVAAAGGARAHYNGSSWVLLGPDGRRANMMSFNSREDAEAEIAASRSDVQEMVQAGFDITPEMRDALGGGAPLFSPRRNIYGRVPTAKWQVDEGSRLDDFLYKIQDKQVDTRRVVEAVIKASGSIDERVNPYLKEELYHGRAAKRTKSFLDTELRPLLEDMRARGVSMDDLETYLWNRHAEERNAQIARVNPSMPDGGSGINTADARAYLAGLSAKQRTAYEALAKRIDAMTSDTRQMMVDYGLEKRETIDAMEAAYSAYVPLHREEMEVDGAPGTGMGYSIRGGGRRAMGSSRPVENIIGQIALQRERVITRGEKNRVGNALLGLAMQQPNTDFWMAINPQAKLDPLAQQRLIQELVGMGLNPVDAEGIIREPVQRYIDPRTGLVAERVNPALRSAPNVVATRVNGEDRFIFFNERNERAMRMSAALKNIDADQLGRVLGTMGAVTRWMAQVNTQYNPVFGIYNFMRDLGATTLQLSNTQLAGQEKAVLSKVLPALRGIYIDLRETRAGRKPRSSWAQLFEQFQADGAQTGYRDLFNTGSDRAESIRRELDPLGGPLGKIFTAGGRLKVPAEVARKAASGIFGWLSDYNEAIENGVRLAAYKTALDQGASREQAASIAKNLTVNFNRKGQVATQAGALYAFFNAAVQGTTRAAQTLAGPAGRKILAGGLLLGAIQALVLAAAGFDDEEPPQWARERSVIIPLAGGDYIAIPMPLGWHVIPGTTRRLTEWAMGGFREPQSAVADLVSLYADAFNPIGNAGLSMQTLSPTALDPLVALTENRDWTGRPIAREDFNALAPTPGPSRAKDTSSTFSRYLAEFLNWSTGGTKYKPGEFSPSPDQIDYLIGQATGGVGREIMKVDQIARAAITGEELPRYKIPLIGRLWGETRGQSSEGNRYYENIRRLNMHEAEIKGRRSDGRPVSDYIRENPEARLFTLANNIERQVGELRRRKRDMVARGAPAEQVRMIEQQITAKMRVLNQRVAAMRE